MSVSADLLRIGLVREATPGVTPATPAFQLLRVTSESITYTPETALSNELNPARQVTDVIVTGGQSGGDIAFELSSNPGLEILLEGALANLWGSAEAPDDLWVGTKLLTHTIEKRFVINEADVDPLARYEFNRAVRSVVDQLTLTFSPGGAAVGSATIIGGLFTRDDVDITGATYIDAGKLPVMVGSGVIPVTFTIAGTDYAAWCVSNLVVTFRNNGRAIACLGQEMANEVVLGRFECEITAEVYVNKETKTAMDAFLDKEEIAFGFTVTDAQANSYEFFFPRVRVSAASENATGTNQDVVLNMTMQALVDTLTITPALPATPFDAETCVQITRVHTTTPWPEGA
jgi:hypothetical protein